MAVQVCPITVKQANSRPLPLLQMNIYKLNKGKMAEIDRDPFSLEKDIQALVEKNLENLFGLEFVSTEFKVGDYRIDTLAFDRDSSAFVIIEYKKGHSYSVIDQGYSYLSAMLQSRAEFILEHNEKSGEVLKRDDIDWSQTKVIFVSPSFNPFQKNSVNFKDVPFELWEIKRFSGDLVVLEQHKTSSHNSIKQFQKGNSTISNVSSEIHVSNETDHTSKASEECVAIWNNIKDYFAGLEDVRYKVIKKYISINKNNKGVCFVRIRKDSLLIDVVRGNISAEEKKSKNFFSFDDPKGLCVEKDRAYVDQRRYSYKLEINSKTNLDYALWLLKQKYDSL